VFIEDVLTHVVEEAVESEITKLDIKLRYSISELMQILDNIHSRVMSSLFSISSECQAP